MLKNLSGRVRTLVIAGSVVVLVLVAVLIGSLALRVDVAEARETALAAAGGGEVSWVTVAVDPASVPELLAATTVGQVTLVVPGERVATATEEPADSAEQAETPDTKDTEDTAKTGDGA